MYQAIKSVKPLNDYKLELKFENGEERIFDMKEYLEIGIFKELKDERLFKSVHVSFDTIEWGNGADLDPEILYQESLAKSASA
jgi:hypothetical protein